MIDLPKGLKHPRLAPCHDCVKANATKLPHTATDVYKPSHVGRLVHADIVGPFRESTIGHYKYGLILVDDHSRYKWVYLLKRKSDALGQVRKFVSSINAIANRGKVSKSQIVGSLHTDNAGELISKEFKEYLDEELIDSSTCPPHVHQLNGVAERAIRTIMENTRSHMVASGAPIGFWPYAIEHAVDIINRATGPPGSKLSAFETLIGIKPKLLPILPFGCRCVGVTPKPNYSKTDIQPRGESGINLGKIAGMPSAYWVWYGRLHRVASVSDVYFDETYMPWRPEGKQRVGPILPLPAPPDDHQPILDAEPAHPSKEATVAPKSLAEAFDQATKGGEARARSSHKVLLLFSGPYNRPDGLAAYLTKLGFEPVLLDNDPDSGGGEASNLLSDGVYRDLVDRVSSGEFCCIFAAPPCSTFSIARFYPSKNGPPILRNRSNIHGLKDLSNKHQLELNIANALIARTCKLLELGWKAGTQFAIENPIDRGDRALAFSFLQAEHGPIWLMPEVIKLASTCECDYANFSQCSFGSEWQKQTTLMYTAGLASWFSTLNELRCTHTTHGKAAGGEQSPDGTWNSREAAAFPPQLNYFIAQAISSLHTREPPKVPPVTSASSSTKAASRSDVDESTPATEPRLSTSAAEPSAHLSPTSARAIDFSEVDDPEVSDHPKAQSPLPKLRRPRKVFNREDIEAQGARVAAHPIRAGLRSFKPTLSIDGALLTLGRWRGKANLAKASSSDPRNLREALADDEEGWTTSMDTEIANHVTNESFEVIEHWEKPRDRNLIKLIWVYKTKRDGSKKSRLCVQGCTQVHGVDYDQTYSGAMRASSLRLLSSIASRKGHRIRRWDFVAAYLQGSLEEGEVIYCRPPPGYETYGKDGKAHVYKVVKPIYGMAQAGRRWQRSLFPWLKEFGFTQSQSDPCVFVCKKSVDSPTGPRDDEIHLGVYVDDLAVSFKHDDDCSLYRAFASKLEEDWKVEDEGDLSDLLGVEFIFLNGKVKLHQQKYIERMVTEFVKGEVPGSAQSNKRPYHKDLAQWVADALTSEDDIDPDFVKQYQSIVGALLYCATNTRPDICYAVGMLCRAICLNPPTNCTPLHSKFSTTFTALRSLG